jgi:poly(A) polymerase
MPDATGPFSNKPPCTREDATAVLTRLRQAGHAAYFAGGCVRDLLLGLMPKDYDVATDALPKQVRKLFSNTQAVGAAFGVILVRHRISVVEVATFRSDEKYEDGRRPSGVRFTSAREDAQRRDFTINGLFLDPLDHDRVIDYVGGQEDLRARRLRAIGDPAARFAEDHLRLLRAVRFAARFSLEIEDQTAAAILRDAPLLKRISPERIADELRLMLTAPTRNTAWQLLWQFRLIDVIYRFLPMPPGLALDRDRSLFLAVEADGPITFGLALAAGSLCIKWLSINCPDDIRPLLAKASVRPLVRTMRQTLKISNEESDEMEGSLEGIAPLLADDAPSVARMKRFLARPTSSHSRRLMRALAKVGLHASRIAWLEQQLTELAGGDVSPAPLITGDDLTVAGLSPGPPFKRILDAVYDAQLEGRINTKEAALRLALSLAAGQR